jgi:hypothetical protein
MNRSLIDQYAAGADVPARAIMGLSAAELNAFPVPGTWSIQQIILHLMDSDLIASDRMKRVIAEESPSLVGYNETAFSRKLFYDQTDAAMACEVFRLNRLLTAAILKRLPDAAFTRTGNHSEHGSLSLADLVESYVEHLDHHMRFLREKRRLLGKPLGET